MRSGSTVHLNSGRRELRRSRQRLAHEVTGVELLGNAMVLFQQRFAIYLGKLDGTHVRKGFLHVRSPQSDVLHGRDDPAEQTSTEQAHVLGRHSSVHRLLHR